MLLRYEGIRPSSGHTRSFFIIFVVVYTQEDPYADAYTPMARSCAAPVRDGAQGDQRGARLPSRPSRPCSRQRPAPATGLGHAPVALCCLAHMGASRCQSGCPGRGGSPAPRSTRASPGRPRTASQPPRRSSPPGARRPLFPREVSCPRPGVSPTHRGPPRS